MLPIYLGNSSIGLPEGYRCEKYEHLETYRKALLQLIDFDTGCVDYGISKPCFEKLRERFILPGPDKGLIRE